MERQELIDRINNLETIQDLLDLINTLKEEDLGEKAYQFTIEQIKKYRNPNKTARRYVEFDIPKKSGKAPRHITAPNSTLKAILFYINRILQAMYEPLPCVMGFTQGKSVVDNAQHHVRKNYVFNLDLKDFFPCISQARVWKKLQCPPFNFKDDKSRGLHRRVLADVIAGLCCMKDSNPEHPWVRKAPNPNKVYVLPQGAPTSPTLTNIICERLDWLLRAVARRFGAEYSRYADDITFSSMHNLYHPDGEFLKEVRRIIEEQGFEINWDKVRLCRKDERQEVTGLTVNEKPNVTRKYIQEIRHNLHEWEVNGYAKAYVDFVKHYHSEKGHIKKGDPALENVLSGKLEYLKMVKGENDPTYIRLNQRFMHLTQSMYKTEFEDSSFCYIVTYPVAVFNDAFGKIQQATSHGGVPYLYFETNGKQEFISFRKGLDLTNIEKLYVSQCESKKDGKRFYLLHKSTDITKAINMSDSDSENGYIKDNKRDSEKEVETKKEKSQESQPESHEDSQTNDYLDEKLHRLINSDFDLNILLD